MATYKVGQAPWEVENNNPVSFKVGEAPWEKNTMVTTQQQIPLNQVSTTPSEKKYSIITGREIPSDLAQRQQEQQANRTVINPKYAAGVSEAFTSGKEQIKSAFQQGQTATNPLQMLEAGTGLAAGAINTLLSPVTPLFSPVSKAIDYTQNKISDIPEVQEFANSKPGFIAERVANDVTNLMTIAGAVTPGGIGKGSPKPIVATEIPKVVTPKPSIPIKIQKLIDKRAVELNNISSQYSDLRKFDSFKSDGGAEIRKRIASTDVLDGAVDENGVIRTKLPGGAVDQYRSMTIENADNVVRKNLEVEASKTPLDEVQIRLEDSVRNSGLEGADLKVALNRVKQEISGLKLRADSEGNIPNTILQDAKVSQYKQINFQTPPEVSTVRKAIANGYKTTIEKNSIFDVRNVNQELAKYLEDIKYLEMLDGKRVKGGKLGKYFAQVTGNIVGGLTGGIIGGPAGSAVGAVVGGEVAGRIKGSAMERSFAGQGITPAKNPVLEQAIQTGKYKRLPAPQEYNLGNLNQQYNPTPMTKSIDTINQSKINPANNIDTTNNASNRTIDTSIPQNKGIVKSLVDKWKDLPNKQGGFIKLPEGKIVKSIDNLTKKEMIQAIDYINLKKPFNQSMEDTIIKLQEKFEIPQTWSSNKVADTLTKIIENTKTTNITKKEASIISLAKKSKTADEFAKAQMKIDFPGANDFPESYVSMMNSYKKLWKEANKK